MPPTQPPQTPVAYHGRGFSRVPIFAARDQYRGRVPGAKTSFSRGAAVRLTSSEAPAIHVPETQRIDDLLRGCSVLTHWPSSSTNTAGSTGVVTLEDILVAIVGDIRRHERAAAPAERLDKELPISPRAGIDGLNETLDEPPPSATTTQSPGSCWRPAGSCEPAKVTRIAGYSITVSSPTPRRHLGESLAQSPPSACQFRHQRSQGSAMAGRMIEFASNGSRAAGSGGTPPPAKDGRGAPGMAGARRSHQSVRPIRGRIHGACARHAPQQRNRHRGAGRRRQAHFVALQHRAGRARTPRRGDTTPGTVLDEEARRRGLLAGRGRSTPPRRPNRCPRARRFHRIHPNVKPTTS